MKNNINRLMAEGLTYKDALDKNSQLNNKTKKLNPEAAVAKILKGLKESTPEQRALFLENARKAWEEKRLNEVPEWVGGTD